MPNVFDALPNANMQEGGNALKYAETRLKVKQYLDTTNGRQTGDPKKAATVIIDVVQSEGMAQNRKLDGTLFLGSDASRDVKARCERTLRNLEEWHDVVGSIDF
jgi:hypothetical protein